MEVMAVDPAKPLTRLSFIEFTVADVKKPLASAEKTVRKNNRVALDTEGSFFMNKKTESYMELKIHDETFVLEVQDDRTEQGTITLDSGAGVNLWPKEQTTEIPMLLKKLGLRVCAANGAEIANHCRKIGEFRGTDFSRARVERSVFSRHV